MFQQTHHVIPVADTPGPDQKLFEWNASNLPIYIGTAPRGAASSDACWTIKLYTWDGNGNPTSCRSAYGAWDNRAGLAYA